VWYLYTSRRGNTYPLELGYKAVDSSEIKHDYGLITGFCKNGCESYNSGGCPPHAPRFEDIQISYKHGVLVFASFFTKYKPVIFSNADNAYINYRFQDIVISSLFTQLGYAVKDNFGADVLFLNSGHCMGCGEQKCSFTRGEKYCRNPKRRTFAIGATGVETARLLNDVFGIELQWHTDNNNEVECITKAMGFFCKNREIQNKILAEMIPQLNSLKTSRFPINSREYRRLLRSML